MSGDTAYLADLLRAAGLAEGREARPSTALQALHDAGYVGAFIYYSGGGDEGGTDEATFIKLDGTRVDVEPWPDGLQYDRDSNSYTHDDADVLAAWQLLNLLEAPIHDKHGSWADGGGYHAEGVLIYDVANWKAVLKEREEITEYEDDERDLLEDYGGLDGDA